MSFVFVSVAYTWPWSRVSIGSGIAGRLCIADGAHHSPQRGCDEGNRLQNCCLVCNCTNAFTNTRKMFKEVVKDVDIEGICSGRVNQPEVPPTRERRLYLDSQPLPAIKTDVSL